MTNFQAKFRMKNPSKLISQFILGGINGFLFGIICEAFLFIFYFISADLDLNSMPIIIYFAFPILSLIVVGVGKVLAYLLLGSADYSIIGWQIAGVFSFVGYIIAGQIRFVILKLFYEVHWENNLYLNELIIGLFVILIYNFFYSILLKAASTKKAYNLK